MDRQPRQRVGGITWTPKTGSAWNDMRADVSIQFD
jgi:hypothetical protein